MNDSIVVLGGSGFLGKQIIRSLVRHGFSKIASISQNSIKTSNKVAYLNLNILDFPKLKKAVHQYKIIVNCTGQITTPITNCFKLNSVGINNIAQVVKGTKKKVFQISTVGLYGTANKVDEMSSVNPETPYSVCKSFAEYILKKELSVSQLTIIRLGNVYGIGSKGIFGYLYKSFYSNRKLLLNNNGDLSRYFMDVNDAAENIVSLIVQKNNSGIYNLIGKEKFTIKQLIKKIESITKVKYKTIFENNIPYENINHVSTTKIKKLFKPIFPHSIDEFIKKHFVTDKTI